MFMYCNESFLLIYTTVVTCCGLSYPTYLTITLNKSLVYSIKQPSLGQLAHCLLLYVSTHIHLELGWIPEHCTFLLLLIKVDFNNWKQISWRKETILLVNKMKKMAWEWDTAQDFRYQAYLFCLFCWDGAKHLVSSPRYRTTFRWGWNSVTCFIVCNARNFL